MVTVKKRARVGAILAFAVLALAVWVVRVASAQDGGTGADQQRARCHEKNAALLPEFEKAVSAHNSCKTSAECVVVTPGCPFGCYVSVAREYASEIGLLARDLVSRRGCQCMYKCSAAPQASCVHGTCTTEARR
jgi:hypothetical protein